jgi:hypothetical protein
MLSESDTVKHEIDSYIAALLLHTGEHFHCYTPDGVQASASRPPDPQYLGGMWESSMCPLGGNKENTSLVHADTYQGSFYIFTIDQYLRCFPFPILGGNTFSPA